MLVAKSGHEASQLCGLLMDVQLGPMNSIDLVAHGGGGAVGKQRKRRRRPRRPRGKHNSAGQYV